MKYRICVINNKRKGGLYSGGKTRYQFGGLIFGGAYTRGGGGGGGPYLRNFTVSQLTKWKSYLTTHISIHIRFAVLLM